MQLRSRKRWSSAASPAVAADGIVLDPYVGSGTTAKVALDRGSPAIGIDLNPKYFKIAAKRIRSTRRPK